VAETASFSPAWWLPGPHLPTIFAKFGRRIAPTHDRVERWATPDGDSVSVARLDAARDDAPTLAILHGLEGGLHSTYVRGLIHHARTRGWGAAALVWRTCDGRIPDAPRMYHSGETGDADHFLRRLVAERPNAPLHVVGISLGANVLCKWLGEQEDQVPSQLQRAAAVSTPFDLSEGSAFLERGFSKVYSRHFVRKLRAKAERALTRHTSLPVDPALLMRARTFWDFDEAFTAPVHGFASADDYYQRSSSLPFLHKVRIPTLLFSAVDDPFLPPHVLDRVRDVAVGNPALRIEFTPRGGHVGWVSGPPWAPRYHMEERVMEWLETPE
jgi:predicted alpha/beta-fold hydrolase